MGNKPMGNRVRKVIRRFAFAGMILCLAPIVWNHCQSLQHRAQQERLRERVKRAEAQQLAGTYGAAQGTGVPAPAAGRAAAGADGRDEPDSAYGQAGKGQYGTGQAGTEAAWHGTAGDDAAPAVLEKYADLYAENDEMAGWLSIEGTRIDYPVMQSEDDEYYLRHDFYGRDNKYGCLYVRGQADLEAGTNFIIYGHHMKDGAMFGDLDLYAEEGFYREHPSFSFDTLYEERTYDIMAVFQSRLYDEEDDVFPYYRFYEAETREEFGDFYDNVKALSLYDTGVEARFGDTFLTLSTCAYHVKDGRFVVVAKRRE